VQGLPIYDVPEDPPKYEVVEQADSVLKEPIGQVRRTLITANGYYTVSWGDS